VHPTAIYRWFKGQIKKKNWYGGRLVGWFGGPKRGELVILTEMGGPRG